MAAVETGHLTGHVTEEQFSQALLGEQLSPAAQEHIAVCGVCRTELESFRAELSDLRVASRDWSEQRSERMAPVRTGKRSTPPGRLRGHAPAYAWAAAGLLAVGLTIPLVDHVRHTTANVTEGRDESSHVDSPEQIAQDNQLLAEVQYELSRRDPHGDLQEVDRPGYSAGKEGK